MEDTRVEVGESAIDELLSTVEEVRQSGLVESADELTTDDTCEIDAEED